MVTDRLIIIGRNDKFPRLVVCAECGGDGYTYEYPIDPSARPYRVPCTRCDGEGAYEKPAVRGASQQPACSPASPPCRGAPTYDATNERWLCSSGMKPVAGATADLSRSTTHEGRDTQVLRECRSPEASEGPAAIPASPKSTLRGTSLLEQVQDVVTVASGFVVFGGLAFFLMVLA